MNIERAAEHLDVIIERNRLAIEDDGDNAEIIKISDPAQRDEIVNMIEFENGDELTHDEAVAIYEMIVTKLI